MKATYDDPTIARQAAEYDQLVAFCTEGWWALEHATSPQPSTPDAASAYANDLVAALVNRHLDDFIFQAYRPFPNRLICSTANISRVLPYFWEMYRKQASMDAAYKFWIARFGEPA